MISTIRSNNKRNRLHIGFNRMEQRQQQHLQQMENKLSFAADNGHHEAARKHLIEMILFVPNESWASASGRSCCWRRQHTHTHTPDEIKWRKLERNIGVCMSCECFSTTRVPATAAVARNDKAIEMAIVCTVPFTTNYNCIKNSHHVRRNCTRREKNQIESNLKSKYGREERSIATPLRTCLDVFIYFCFFFPFSSYT